MVEYGLLLALLALVVVGSVVTVAGYLDGSFHQLQTEMSTNGIPSK
jgi:Flp pilus assembly pilin Flp